MAAQITPKRHELRDSFHAIPAGAIAIRKTNPNQRIELTLAIRRKKDLPDLSSLDFKAPRERAYMTRASMAAEFGSDPGSMERVKAFALKHRLTILHEDPAAARVVVAGAIDDASTAFGVQLLDYKSPTLGMFHARTTGISTPPELAEGDITGVFGFNNHRVVRRAPRKGQTETAAGTSGAKQTASAAFSPTQLTGIYGLPAADLSGQAIGILEFGGGIQQADIDAYFKGLKLDSPRISSWAAAGVSTDPADDPESTMEVMLDVEVAGAMAPGAKIAMYFSTFDEKGVIDALAAVIADGANDPSVISISWGWDENQGFNSSKALWSPSAMNHVNHSLLAIAHLGITVCVSTGDDGSEAQIRDGHAHVNFPATSPYVLAVGGTTLHAHKAADGSVQVQERVWNNGPGGGGTGGGVSDYTPMPSWQEGIVPKSINHGHFAGRAIPDVAANADPQTGYKVRINGKSTVVGGTSASAPLWACLVARLNASLGARVGNFNALLYSSYGPKGALRDITVGNNDTEGLLNGSFAAKAGWDACTGWGVPDGNKLLEAMKK